MKTQYASLHHNEMEKAMETKTLKGSALALTGLLFLAGSAALAEETVVISAQAPETKRNVNRAFEVGLGLGYLKGFGKVGASIPSLTDTGRAGTSLSTLTERALESSGSSFETLTFFPGER